MPKEAVLSADVRVFMKECTLLNPGVTARELRENYEPIFKKEKIANPGKDSWRQIRKVVFDTRPGLDVPWSIGVAEQAGMPLAVMDGLSKAWAQCFMQRRPFNLCHARWFARLWTITLPVSSISAREEYDIPPAHWLNDIDESDRIQWVIRLAEVYAEFEKTNLRKGKPLDTKNLDAVILMPQDTFWKALRAGLVQRTMVLQLQALAIPQAARILL